MNKEERKCLNDCGFANVTQLLLAYVSLQQENQQLKKDKKFYSNAFVNLRNRNDKAIEYIETATIDPQSMRHYRGCLLEILKGYNKEE